MSAYSYVPHVVIGESVDELVVKGVRLIQEVGCDVTVRAGQARQAYSVTYVLTNSRNRIHLLRAPKSVRYLCRELIAYFRGSLKASDGLCAASSFWETIADENGLINSNYGYYVFRQLTDAGITQYQWVMNCLLANLETRRAVININSVSHKSDTRDFPCTLAIQFFVMDNHLCCEVASRSTDIITGLPYDIGFFSLLTELVWCDLRERKYSSLELGFTSMKPTFTQIYAKRNGDAKKVLVAHNGSGLEMPPITSAHAVLCDIYNSINASEVMGWIQTNAELVQT